MSDVKISQPRRVKLSRDEIWNCDDLAKAKNASELITELALKTIFGFIGEIETYTLIRWRVFPVLAWLSALHDPARQPRRLLPHNSESFHYAVFTSHSAIIILTRFNI